MAELLCCYGKPSDTSKDDISVPLQPSIKVCSSEQLGPYFKEIKMSCGTLTSLYHHFSDFPVNIY